jgi:hypothetical protein
LLSSKFEALQLPIFQFLPQLIFSSGDILSQFSGCSGSFIGHGHPHLASPIHACGGSSTRGRNEWWQGLLMNGLEQLDLDRKQP